MTFFGSQNLSTMMSFPFYAELFAFEKKFLASTFPFLFSLNEWYTCFCKI